MRIHLSVSIIVIAATATVLLLMSLPVTAQDIPRLADGKPDFNGIWDRPRVGNVVTNGTSCGAATVGCVQEGAGELPFTDLGLQRWEGYQPDWTGYCLPWGYTRAMGTSYPHEIIQTPNRLAFLFESNNIFHVIRIDEEHPQGLEQSWLGHSVAEWDGDTLVIDTIGFNDKTYIDTAHHPMSADMHVVERISFIDVDHLSYQVTWDDPTMYTRTFENNRVFVRMSPGSELYEYWCMENNKDLLENRLPPLIEP